jgi:xylan 1,4-beta-xylosidase
VRRAAPTARVGGPETAGGPGGKFLENFIEHCLRGTNAVSGQRGTPLDFVSFHAKGAPKFVDGHVRMGVSNQLNDIDRAFAVIARFPELKEKPVIIGESDPDGCAACQGAQLGYRNSTMYSSYTAASFAREFELAEKYGVNLEGALTWAFEFEEQPYFAGFRALATNSIDLPVLNVFRMFSKLNGDRLKVKSDGEVPLESIVKDGVRDRPDVSAFSSIDKYKLYVLAWHYHDDDLPGPDANVQIDLTGLPVRPGLLRVRQYRIDGTNSNAFAAWQRMGSPQKPSAQQYRELERAGQLAELAFSKVKIENSAGHINVVLPRQAVALVVVEF